MVGKIEMFYIQSSSFVPSGLVLQSIVKMMSHCIWTRRMLGVSLQLQRNLSTMKVQELVPRMSFVAFVNLRRVHGHNREHKQSLPRNPKHRLVKTAENRASRYSRNTSSLLYAHSFIALTWFWLLATAQTGLDWHDAGQYGDYCSFRSEVLAVSWEIPLMFICALVATKHDGLL